MRTSVVCAMRALGVGLLVAVVAACATGAPASSVSGIQPAASQAAAASQMPAGRPMLTCGSLPFDASALIGGGIPPDAHPANEALAAVLSKGGADGLDRLPKTGWVLVAAVPARADFMAVIDDAWAFISFVPRPDGWEPEKWGPCTPGVLVEGLELAEWTLDPDQPLPEPESTTFSALVTERACASGRPMGDRLRPPSMWFTESGLVVLFTVTPQPGGHDCQGNPSSRVIVKLPEPLGDRQLYDGSVFPPEAEI